MVGRVNYLKLMAVRLEVVTKSYQLTITLRANFKASKTPRVQSHEWDAAFSLNQGPTQYA